MYGRAFARIGLLLGLSALIIQFFTTWAASSQLGRSFFGSIVFYFSFFTILTNSFLVLVYVAYLRGRPSFFALPSVRACAATSITLVMLVYATMLAALYAPQGLSFAADTVLHYVSPSIYLAWWLLFAADGSVRLVNILKWVSYPITYFVAICIRWLFVAEMPYPFINPANGGWAHVGWGVVLISVFFCLIGLTIIAMDRVVGALRR